MTELLHVSTATETRGAALTLAGDAVRQRLAASAQVTGPVASAFWHLGEFGQGEEWQAVLLTTADRYAALEAFLIEHHPWKNPQITAVVIEKASQECVQWARDSVS